MLDNKTWTATKRIAKDTKEWERLVNGLIWDERMRKSDDPVIDRVEETWPLLQIRVTGIIIYYKCNSLGEFLLSNKLLPHTRGPVLLSTRMVNTEP